ncbi:hypothetical protein V475_12320 [Sphingobium baderi LL03]|uniref:Uncharacterized protein n=2 Tax=Sphingobium TaxID=165695 RepID=T0G8W1_9SPHN|nr:hypothetical protein L485_23720 [Sphingobium baderi LL03]KMS64382.1 hypothetical protein V475_12320 [Sphingobium baderi LL03]
MEMIRYLASMAALVCLTACGSGPADGVGGVSASEASALNDAAAMLDARAGQIRDKEAGLNPAAMTALRADRDRAEPADENGSGAKIP